MQASKVDFVGSIVSAWNAVLDEKLKTTHVVLNASPFPMCLKIQKAVAHDKRILSFFLQLMRIWNFTPLLTKTLWTVETVEPGFEILVIITLDETVSIGPSLCSVRANKNIHCMCGSGYFLKIIKVGNFFFFNFFSLGMHRFALECTK